MSSKRGSEKWFKWLKKLSLPWTLTALEYKGKYFNLDIFSGPITNIPSSLGGTTELTSTVSNLCFPTHFKNQGHDFSKSNYQMNLSISGQLPTLKMQLALYSRCYYLPLLCFLSAEDPTLKDAAMRACGRALGTPAIQHLKVSLGMVFPRRIFECWTRAVYEGDLEHELGYQAEFSPVWPYACYLSFLSLFLYLGNGVKRTPSGTCEGQMDEGR